MIQSELSRIESSRVRWCTRGLDSFLRSDGSSLRGTMTRCIDQCKPPVVVARVAIFQMTVRVFRALFSLRNFLPICAVRFESRLNTAPISAAASSSGFDWFIFQSVDSIGLISIMADIFVSDFLWETILSLFLVVLT